MKAPKFERNKVAQLIRTHGERYLFRRDELNKFKEPVDDIVIAEIMGIFHQTMEHILVTGSDASSIQDKTSPFILALYDDAKDIKQGDKVTINGQPYLVNGATNVGQWNIALDISVEAVL